MMVRAFNPSTQETKQVDLCKLKKAKDQPGLYTVIPGLPGPRSETLSQNKQGKQQTKSINISKT